MIIFRRYPDQGNPGSVFGPSRPIHIGARWAGSVDSTSGYGGMQYTADGFQYRYSIWNDYAVPAWHDSGMQYSTFGGEGTGVTSWTYAYPWSADVWNVMADRAWDAGSHTMMAFSCPGRKIRVWRHLITWDVPLAHQRYGYYLIIFWRTGSNRGKLPRISFPPRLETQCFYAGLVPDDERNVFRSSRAIRLKTAGAATIAITGGAGAHGCKRGILLVHGRGRIHLSVE